MTDWPVAALDPVRRLRVMASAVGGAMYWEQDLDLPLEQVWAVASDLEGELPYLLRDVRSFTFLPRVDGDERLQARARGLLGHQATFDVVLEPGWCLMQSRLVVGGMAATEVPGGTRFAVLGGLRLPAIRHLQPVLSPVGSHLGRGMIGRLVGRATLRQR